MIKTLLLRSLFVLLSTLSVLAHAADEPLMPEQAFRVEVKIVNDTTLSEIGRASCRERV